MCVCVCLCLQAWETRRKFRSFSLQQSSQRYTFILETRALKSKLMMGVNKCGVSCLIQPGEPMTSPLFSSPASISIFFPSPPLPKLIVRERRREAEKERTPGQRCVFRFTVVRFYLFIFRRIGREETACTNAQINSNIYWPM